MCQVFFAECSYLFLSANLKIRVYNWTFKWIFKFLLISFKFLPSCSVLSASFSNILKTNFDELTSTKKFIVTRFRTVLIEIMTIHVKKLASLFKYSVWDFRWWWRRSRLWWKITGLLRMARSFIMAESNNLATRLVKDDEKVPFSFKQLTTLFLSSVC